MGGIRIIRSNIESFFNIVYDLKKSIDTVDNNGFYTKNHKLTLIISLLDFLSKAYKPDCKSNRIRFCSLIEDMTSLDYLNKVSIPQLYYYLQIDCANKLSEIRQIIKTKYEQFPRSQPVDVDIDIKVSDISNLWPVGYKYNGRIVSLEKFKHINLIWAERNNLIHEMRRRTLGESFFNERERPYYVHYLGRCIEAESYEEEYFELCYPEKIYELILNECIRNSKKYFIKNNINPFLAFNSDRLIAVEL